MSETQIPCIYWVCFPNLVPPDTVSPSCLPLRVKSPDCYEESSYSVTAGHHDMVCCYQPLYFQAVYHHLGFLEGSFLSRYTHSNLTVEVSSVVVLPLIKEPTNGKLPLVRVIAPTFSADFSVRSVLNSILILLSLLRSLVLGHDLYR
jgi:hypothetical protein